MEQQNQKISEENFMDEFFLHVHDLKSPIDQIKGLLEIARKNSDNKETKEILDMAIHANNKMLTKVQMMLKDSISSNNEIDEVIDFRKMFDDIKQSLSSMQGFHQTRFALTIPDSMEYDGDPIKIQSIFQNLIENAIKYRKRGNEPNIIIVGIQKFANTLIVKISDNGKGINSDLLPYIFDRGYKIKNSSNGHGIGLYLVKETLHSMGASIKVESLEGEGTTFTMNFPYNGL